MDERRPVTILFTDIVGSAALAEQLDPEEWKEIVNAAHQRVSAAITRYEGTVAQLLGDGVLAFFGAPRAHEDDPIRATKAGLAIQAAMQGYARSLQGYLEHFQMRVGIHTGMVVVGAVGSPEHSEYLAVGDAVNLAARIQSAAQPGRVLLSDVTARLVRQAFELMDLGEITVKGKTAPIHVFEVVETRFSFSSGRGIEGLTSPLVGRERELEQLRAALAELDAGLGQIVFLLGEAGIGKSRLVEEARRMTDDEGRTAGDTSVHRQQSSIHWLEGRALSYGQALPFWTITQLLQNDLGLADGDLEVRIKVALRRRVQELFGDKADQFFPYLAHLLGVKLDGEAAARVKPLDGETLKRQTLLAVGEYFSRTAEQQPTVLVLEDLHWSDTSTLETLEELFTLTNRVPLMLLALMRVERDHGSWRIKQAARTDYEHRYTEINLKLLSADEQNRLVNNLLQVAELPETTRRLIVERAEGNPFYLEEIIRHLIEQGAIVRVRDDPAGGHYWRASTEIATLEIPDTLRGVLLARIDRLESDLRRTLQLASVIGKTFLYRLLQAIAVAERELDTQLAQLQRADLVREKARRPELEYMFKHALTQEAAYDSLLLERRREFHRKVGAALEEMYAERRDEFLGLLAYHFDRAGEREKAIDYMLRVGDKTRLSDAHDEAIQYYRRAIELLHEIDDREREAKTWLKLGLIYHANFEFEKAHAANKKAFETRREKPQQTRTESAAAQQERPRQLVQLVGGGGLRSLDPSRMMNIGETWTYWNLFAGLVEIDAELNVIPDVATSWEVMNEGTRYVFHLRDDVYWTDGSPVTALDFEWAWKRNLSPTIHSIYARMLDEVVGARAFREGLNPDPNSVGVKALDALTLDVRLERPVAYFPFVLAYPITFPLHRATVERYGDKWCEPPHMVSNGAYRLMRLDTDGMVWERNRNYFGEVSGNVGRVEFRFIPEQGERWRAFLQGEGDVVYAPGGSQVAPFEIMRSEYNRNLWVELLELNAQLPPLNDVRVRRALAHALDLESPAAVRHATPAHGGMVHPAVPGHSPGLKLPFDPEQARRLFIEAGYPDGAGFPSLILEHSLGSERHSEEIVLQWQDILKVRVERRPFDFSRPHHNPGSHCGIFGFVGDYPDPDTFLRQLLGFHTWLTPDALGAQYMQLVEDAVQVGERAQRMAMYREADRILVVERALVIPLDYGGKLAGFALRTWVKGLEPMPTVSTPIKRVRIEPH